MLTNKDFLSSLTQRLRKFKSQPLKVGLFLYFVILLILYLNLNFEPDKGIVYMAWQSLIYYVVVSLFLYGVVIILTNIFIQIALNSRGGETEKYKSIKIFGMKPLGEKYFDQYSETGKWGCVNYDSKLELNDLPIIDKDFDFIKLYGDMGG
jgi:hypothetical protein